MAFLNPVQCFRRLLDRWTDLPDDLVGIALTYISTLNSIPSFGLFGFFNHHVPYWFNQDLIYLEWLVSIDMQLKHEFPKDHTHAYLPHCDTVATVESFILTTLGKLETERRNFNRIKLFSNWPASVRRPSPLILFYAKIPPTKIWKSPLTARELLAPEAAAIKNIRKLCFHLAQCCPRNGLHWTTYLNDNFPENTSMTIAESIFLAFLAQTDYLEHIYLNPDYPPLMDTVCELVRSPQKEFLSSNLLKYLQLF